MRVYIVLILLSLLFSCEDDKKKNQDTISTDSTKIKDSVVVVEIPKEFSVIGEILPNKGFAEAILFAGQINDSTTVISNRQMLDIVNQLSQEVDMRFIKAGEKFEVKFTKDTSSIVSFEYSPDEVTTYRVFADSVDGKQVLKSETLVKPTELRYKLVYGVLDTINRTLDEALRSAGLPGNLTQTVNNIMVCKVSFRYDARYGDSSLVLVEEKVYNDKVVDGTVLYASYKGKRAGFTEAFFYRDGDPKSSYNAYYTPDGRALVNNALRYPLDNIHVVSAFGMRTHPVTGQRKMHTGVDFRGSSGTPVYAAARGVVAKSFVNAYGGNTLAIRHSDGTESYYLHLSRKLAKIGQHVVARQLIGKVGATGRVTGPHLHFGIKTPQGKWVNPMKKRMIATPQLESEKMKKLKIQMKLYESFRDSLLAL